MSIERLQQEADDTKLMVQTVLDSMLKDMTNEHNDMELGKKMRTYKSAVTKLRHELKKL